MVRRTMKFSIGEHSSPTELHARKASATAGVMYGLRQPIQSERSRR